MSIDLRHLMRCLPISDLEAHSLGFVSGWHEPDASEYTQPAIEWVEPPAGVRVPYVDPVQATTILLRHQGMDRIKAQTVAQADFAALRPSLKLVQRVRYLDEFHPDSPEHIPGDCWLDHLRTLDRVPEDVLTYLRRTLSTCAECTAYDYPDFPGQRLSLLELPAQPPANSMVQFQPGCPWGEEEGEAAGIAGGCSLADWRRWRDSMRPHAAAIEARWGSSPLYLADPDDELDDDLIHRFMLLHWCCSSKPDAMYVQFLLEASGASSLDQLKAALLEPDNYALPFDVTNVYDQMAPRASRFVYVPPSKKTPFVTIAFEEASCLPVVYDLVRLHLSKDVLLIDPNKHMTEDGFALCERYAREFIHQLGWREGLDELVEVLARTDVLCVVEGAGAPDERPILSDSLRQLIGFADVLQVETHYHFAQGGSLWNFMSRPELAQASVQARALLDEAPDYLSGVDEIHVWCDFFASGLWTKRGAMFGYDTKVLPWDLIRRLSAWQWDHDRTIDPPQHMGTDEWWDMHQAQGRALAREIQQAVGPGVKVMVHEEAGPTWIADIPKEINPQKAAKLIRDES